MPQYTLIIKKNYKRPHDKTAYVIDGLKNLQRKFDIL